MYVITRILITITLLHPALCIDIPAPVNLSISSQYFVHLLSWKMGPGSPDGVHYEVSMCSLSNRSPMVVKGCEAVTSPLSCNLTDVLSDLEETYYISVSAGMGNWTSPPAHCSPFNPIQNTTLEPPLVTVSACNQSLCVSLKAPAPKLHDIYNSFNFNYRLMISSEVRKFHEDTTGLHNVTLKNLAPGRQYCVTVKIIDRSSHNSPPVCAFTPKTANSSDTMIGFVLCLVILLLLMSIIPRLVSQFYLKADLPTVLSSFHSPYKWQHLLIPSADFINKLYEETDFLQKMKRNQEEHEEIEAETDEGVMYEKLLTCFEDGQTSSSSIVPSSSSCGLLMDQSSDTHTGLTSSTDVQGCSLSFHEGSWVPETESVASTEVTLNVKRLSCRSISLTHVEQEDSCTMEVESDTDVNLFSVTLGGITAERHEADADQTCCITDELDLTDLSSQSPFKSATTSLWLSDFKPLNSETLEMHISDSEEEDDEYSGYLNRT